MAYFNFRAFLRSLRYAAKGLRYIYQHEQNFRVQLLVAAAVLILMAIVRVTALQAIALSTAIMAVLVLEILNTTVEKFVDIVKPRMHYLVEVIKDLMAAAVVITSIGALIIGLIIFLPYFFPQ